MQMDQLAEMQLLKREHDVMFPGLGNFSAEELGMTAEEFSAYVNARGAA